MKGKISTIKKQQFYKYMNRHGPQLNNLISSQKNEKLPKKNRIIYKTEKNNNFFYFHTIFYLKQD